MPGLLAGDGHEEFPFRVYLRHGLLVYESHHEMPFAGHTHVPELAVGAGACGGDDDLLDQFVLPVVPDEYLAGDSVQGEIDMVPVQRLAGMGFGALGADEFPDFASVGTEDTHLGHRGIDYLSAFQHPHVVEFVDAPQTVMQGDGILEHGLAVPYDMKGLAVGVAGVIFPYICEGMARQGRIGLGLERHVVFLRHLRGEVPVGAVLPVERGVGAADMAGEGGDLSLHRPCYPAGEFEGPEGVEMGVVGHI